MSTLAGGSQEAGDLGLELCRSLKCEEVNLKAYDTVPEARAGIKEWIRFYNYGRTPSFIERRTMAQLYCSKSTMELAAY